MNIVPGCEVHIIMHIWFGLDWVINNCTQRVQYSNWHQYSTGLMHASMVVMKIVFVRCRRERDLSSQHTLMFSDELHITSLGRVASTTKMTSA